MTRLQLLTALGGLLLATETLHAEPELGAGPMNGLGEGAPVCTFIPALNYPPALREHRLGGQALVRVFVDETGRVFDTELVESALPELFIVEALKTARLSRFGPALRDGRGERSSMLLLLTFPRFEGSLPATEAAAVPADSKPAPSASPPPRPAAQPVANADTVASTAAAPPAPAPQPSSTSLRVLDAGFGHEVSDRALVGRGQVFAEGDRAYFWMEVDGARPGQVLRHVWIFRGREVQEIPLTMKAARWTSWSYKTLFPGLAGPWLLELRDENDHLLGSWTFHCE